MIKKYSLFVIFTVVVFQYFQKDDGDHSLKKFKYSRLTERNISSIDGETKKDEFSDRTQYKQSSIQSDNDPYQEEHLKSKELAKKLDEIYQNALRDPKDKEDISEIGRKYIQIDNSFVKKAALNLLSTQPASEANLQSIMTGIIDYHDGYLVDQALVEFEKYKNDSQSLDQIHQGFLKNLEFGSLFIRKRIANSLIKFKIGNYKEDYRQLLARKNFPPSIRRLIENAINRG